MVSGAWFVNDFDLDTITSAIETTDGHRSTPGWNGDDLDVAGWHGTLDVSAEPGTQRRAFRPGRWQSQMWVLGVDPTTGADLPTGQSLAAVEQRIDTLNRLFHARSLRIKHVREDGTVRQAIGHLSSQPIDHVLQVGSPWFGQFVVDITLPDPFWYEPNPVTASSPGLPTGGVLSLAPFAAATAPMRAVDLRFGPGNNPSLAQAGGFWAWAGVIAAARELGVSTDPRDPSLFASAGAWSPAYSGISYSPGPSWFELDPTVAPMTAVLTHTGGGVMPVSVTARIAHLTS